MHQGERNRPDIGKNVIPAGKKKPTEGGKEKHRDFFLKGKNEGSKNHISPQKQAHQKKNKARPRTEQRKEWQREGGLVSEFNKEEGKSWEGGASQKCQRKRCSRL